VIFEILPDGDRLGVSLSAHATRDFFELQLGGVFDERFEHLVTATQLKQGAPAKDRKRFSTSDEALSLRTRKN
jgi:hypothetical protein